MLVWLAPILVFGLVVLVHEVGHFVAAKLVGVYAPRFSIGFGRPLWRKRRGETEYVIGILPLGGYVRMASREDEATSFIEGGSEDSRVGVVGANDAAPMISEGGTATPKDWDPNAMMPFGPKPVPPQRWFESQPLWARLFILSAGVIMNVVLALAISTTIFAVNGRVSAVAVVDSVLAGKPAALAGLQRGDSIVAIGGTPVTRWEELTDRVRSSPGQALEFEVMRGGTRQTLQVTPAMVVDTVDETGRTEQVGQVGVLPKRHREPISIVEAASAGWTATWRMAGMVGGVVGDLVTGQRSVAELGGPIAIAKSSVEAARGGVEVLFYLIALLSVNVAVLNLLPIPLLDGGQILLNLLEAAKGSAFSARTKEYILRAGLVAIALLFALVMFNDLGLRRLFG
jgi:regulator of sigma E protease